MLFKYNLIKVNFLLKSDDNSLYFHPASMIDSAFKSSELGDSYSFTEFFYLLPFVNGTFGCFLRSQSKKQLLKLIL